VTILFMVLCCCSADIILNKFPDWEKWSFSRHNYRQNVAQKGFFIFDQFASRQNYSGTSSGFPSISVRALLPVTLVIVGCKRASIHLKSVQLVPNDSVVHQGQNPRRIANPVHDMCGRECRLLNILKIIMEILIQF
jgi:hypothetical protein